MASRQGFVLPENAAPPAPRKASGCKRCLDGCGQGNSWWRRTAAWRRPDPCGTQLHPPDAVMEAPFRARIRGKLRGLRRARIGPRRQPAMCEVRLAQDDRARLRSRGGREGREHRRAPRIPYVACGVRQRGPDERAQLRQRTGPPVRCHVNGPTRGARRPRALRRRGGGATCRCWSRSRVGRA